jgi:periplasmic mercuric ion binding protein
MKTLLILFFSLISLLGVAQSVKTIKTDIKVYGNCGMCKARIEKALDRTGIKTAAWDSKTKMLSIVYNPSKIKEQQLHNFIAEAGHDTDKAKAKDEVYAKLPFCCLYRDHDHSGMHDGDHR